MAFAFTLRPYRLLSACGAFVGSQAVIRVSGSYFRKYPCFLALCYIGACPFNRSDFSCRYFVNEAWLREHPSREKIMPERCDLAGAAIVPLLMETAFPVDRKMCACSTKLEILPDIAPSWQGRLLRSPVASLLKRSKSQGVKHSLKT